MLNLIDIDEFMAMNFKKKISVAVREHVENSVAGYFEAFRTSDVQDTYPR